MADHAKNLENSQNTAANSICPSTQRVYTTSWNNFKNYCATNALGKWAATTNDVTAFLQSVYDRNQSVPSVYTHLSAIAYFYRLKGLVSPTENNIVTMFMKGLKRQALIDKPAVKRAKPLTKDVLAKLNNFLLSNPRSLRVWRTIWRVNLAFMCLLRWDDVCRLKVSDFDLVNDDGVPSYEFVLNGGKTVMNEPHSTRRLYAHPGSSHCPLQITRQYFVFLGEHRGSVIPTCQAGNKNLPHPTRSVGYSNACEDFRYVLGLVDVNPAGYSEHSMKRGGATEAARCGASRDEIQHAGHWRCQRTVEKYIEASNIRQRNFRRYLAQ